MIFQNRQEAGKKLAEVLIKDREILKEKKNIVVVSLLRGGALVGKEIADKLSLPHFPLVVKKISAPHNEELAIGALCGGQIFLDHKLINNLNLDQKVINQQIKISKDKQKLYQKRYDRFLKKPDFTNKSVILVDDGVATGSTVKVAAHYLRLKSAKKIYLALPVAPGDFKGDNFDRVFILHKDPFLTAISSYYHDFHQATDEEIVKIFSLFER